MEEYSKETYGSFNAFKKCFANELKQAFCGTKCLYKEQNAYFADFDWRNTTSGELLIASIDLNGEIKGCGLPIAYWANVVNVEGDAKKDFEEYFKLLARANETHRLESEKEFAEINERNRIAHEQYLKRLEKLAKLKEEQAIEEKYQNKVSRALKKLNSIRPEKTARLFATPMSQYEIIGWMAKHATSIRAAMPDYMESWFVKHFGDKERYVVDSRKKTSGGYAYQWGLSLKVTFDEAVSGPLEQRATSQNKKVIDNVSFVWDLVENYGFQFGKEQDIEAIKSLIPQDYIQDFEKGLSM